MRKIYYLLCFSVCSLYACRQQGQQSNTQNNPKDTSIIVKRGENPVKEKLPTIPQEIAPIDVKKLQSYTIEDYHKFWLALKIAEINDQINTGGRSRSIGDIVYTIENLGNGKITKKDTANGYLLVHWTFGNMGFEEMALWKSKTGKGTLVVAGFGCGPVCKCNELDFYEIENGKLVNKTADYYPKKEIREMMNSQHDAKLALYKQKNPGDKISHLSNWVIVPQIGTNIQFGWNHTVTSGISETFYPVCELQYNTDNGTFKLVKL